MQGGIPMGKINYNRSAAVSYARRWALSRNPAFFDFSDIGGDCTNFASQCLLAGSQTMNYTPVTGWYYRSAADRSASWTGVEYLFRFLTQNDSVGPFARVVTALDVQPGDIVQLGRADGHFYHSPVILSVSPEILIAAHSIDSLDRPLASYNYEQARFLHIDGVRVWPQP